MSILIIQLPARARMSGDAESADASVPSPVSREYSYVLTADGLTATRQGRCAAPMLPRADSVVAVMAPTDVSWHRLPLPKAPAARLRAALAGLLEEALLDDPDDLHFAVAPEAKAGQPVWVAVCDHTWLTGHLMTLEKAKLRVERVVPGVVPDEPATAYFSEAAEVGDESESGGETLLTWSTADGVASWPLSGSLARELLPDPLPPQARFFATPPVASPAERWLGRAVTVQTQPEHLLMAAQSLWNMLQFELTPRSKGLQVLTDRWRRFMGPQWRPARMGLLALAAVQVIGLNLWAWHQSRQVSQRKAQLVAVVKQAHPQLQVVIDPAVQMRRETDALRAAAGVPGDNDLETLMGAVAAAWPSGQPTRTLMYDGSSLTVTAPTGWSGGDIEQFRDQLTAAGLEVEASGDGRLLVRHGSKG